jgi:hypothetical protein
MKTEAFGGCYRIVVCLDVDASNADSAYRAVREAMTKATASKAIAGWESTEEWFDDEGRLIPEDEIARVRAEVTFHAAKARA